MDHYFGHKNVDYVHIKANQLSKDYKIVTYFTNPVAFIEHVKEQRQVDDICLKIGIDVSGGFLKICLSVLSTANPQIHHARMVSIQNISKIQVFKDSRELSKCCKIKGYF